MRITWKLKNYSSQDFSVVSVFAGKMTWKTQLGYLNLKELLSLVASKLSRETQKSLDYCNPSQWSGMESSKILSGRQIHCIKKGDKGSCVVVWDRFDYIKETERHFGYGIV